MKISLQRWTLPLALTLLPCAPAAAQVSVGLEIGQVFVRIAPEPPPAPRMEVRMSPPSRDHVWVEGYWDRVRDRWTWCPGRWERPARQGVAWVRPQYLREGDAWRYEPGHWSHQRLAEGEDYARWRHDHGRRREEDRGHDREKDHHRGHGWGRDGR